MLIFLKTAEIVEAGKLVIRPGMITLYASVLAAAYIAFDMYRTSESEWKELYDNLLALCPDEKLKDNQTASIAPDIKENDALRPDWVISVVYDSKKTSVFYEDGNWFLDVKSGKPGEEYLPLNCNDAKLANKTFGEIGGELNAEEKLEKEKLEKEKLNNATKTLDDFKKSEKGFGHESTAIEVSPGKFKRNPGSAMTYTWDATGNKFVGAVD